MTTEELDNRFTYHPPTDDQAKAYPVICREAKKLARTILELCPECREQSLAITKIEEVVMWANAAVARRSGDE